MNKSLNLNYPQITKKYIDELKYLHELNNLMLTKIKSTKSHYFFTPLDTLFKPYKTADILIIDDDPIVRTILTEKLKNVIIKKDSEDQGRSIKLQIGKNCDDLLNSIENLQSTYGFILIDHNLGADSITGCECVKKLRNKGYKGPVYCITASNLTKELVEEVKENGADGIIYKDINTFIKDINKLITKCISREINDSSDEE